MADEIYVNKRGFKCVRSQLAKTDGRDPQDYETARKFATENSLNPKTETDKLPVKAAEYAA